MNRADFIVLRGCLAHSYLLLLAEVLWTRPAMGVASIAEEQCSTLAIMRHAGATWDEKDPAEWRIGSVGNKPWFAGQLGDLCQADSLVEVEARRLFHHLPASCATCWDHLLTVQLPARELPPTNSPIVAALRALTTDDVDRLTPLQRLVRCRGRHWHLGFCRLVAEESLGLICADADKADIVDVSALLELASRELPREQRHDLFALDHIREIDLAIHGSRIEYAKKSVLRAMLQYMSGTADPELKAALVSAEARLWCRRGHRATAAHILKSAVEALEAGGPDLDERRAEILTERAFYLSLDGQLGRGRGVLEEALEILEALESACPSLKLTILHNLATTEANLSLARPDDDGGLDLTGALARIEEAAGLYERYGTPSLRAQRDALLALGQPEPERLVSSLYRTALGFERSGLPVEAAQVAFELLEWLERQGECDAAGAVMAELRERLAGSPEIADCFEFFAGRVRELTQLGDLPQVPARLLRQRLELLERLIGDRGATRDTGEVDP